MADDIFEHDDGVIDHKPDREGQGHEGEVIEAEVQEIHGGEGAHDGEGKHQARNEGGGEVPKKEKDDQNDQAERQETG